MKNLIKDDVTSLLGDPLPAEDSRLSRFVAHACRKEYTLSALSALFCVAAGLVCSPPVSGRGALFLGLTVAGWALLTRKIERQGERDRIIKTAVVDPKNKQINRRPEPDVLPSDGVYWRFCAQSLLKNKILACGVGIFLMTGFSGLMVGCGVIGGTSASIAVGATYIAAVVPDAMLAFQWYKVARGNWVVEDRVPPRKRIPVAEKAKTRRFGIFAPAQNIAQ